MPFKTLTKALRILSLTRIGRASKGYKPARHYMRGAGPACAQQPTCRKPEAVQGKP